jgi:5-methylcytosine-specific restriction enzyme B
VTIHPHDLSRWRSKLDQIEAAVDLDEEVKERWAEADALRSAKDEEARPGHVSTAGHAAYVR